MRKIKKIIWLLAISMLLSANVGMVRALAADNHSYQLAEVNNTKEDTKEKSEEKKTTEKSEKKTETTKTEEKKTTEKSEKNTETTKTEEKKTTEKSEKKTETTKTEEKKTTEKSDDNTNKTKSGEKTTPKTENTKQKSKNAEALSVDEEISKQEPIILDLVIFAGQSNMSGAGGDAKKAPEVARGVGFEFQNGIEPIGVSDVTEPFGIKSVGRISDPGGRKGTLVSSFMNTYYAATGVPIIGISASCGGTDMNSFWMLPEVRAELMQKYTDAKNWCAANNILIRHQYVVWLQGESDALHEVSAANYQNNLTKLFKPFFKKGVEQVFVITPGNLANVPGAFDTIISAQADLCNKNAKFTLASASLRYLPDTYLTDTIHYNQEALNMVGAEAASVMAAYTALH